MSLNHQVIIEAVRARLEEINREIDDLVAMLDRIEALEAEEVE